MQSFIKLFPLIYSIWGGILIVAGILIVLGFSKKMSFTTQYIKYTDKMNTTAVTVISILNFISLFVRHAESSYILDALILGHFWCTIYFVALSCTQLCNLPTLTKRI